jgi:hypothetical protein
MTNDGLQPWNIFASDAGRAVARLAGSSHRWMIDSYSSMDVQYVGADLRFGVNDRQHLVVEIEVAEPSDPADPPGPWVITEVAVQVRPDENNVYRSSLEGDKVTLDPSEFELARLAEPSYRAELAKKSMAAARRQTQSAR